MTTTPVVAPAISYLRFSSSHSSSIDAAQHISSFLSFSSRRRPTPSKATYFISSSNSHTSFPTFPVPVPFKTVSHHAVVVKRVIPSAPTQQIPIVCHRSSAVLNSFTASNSSRLDWTPLRFPCIVKAIDFSFEDPDDCKHHWLIVMDTFGFEFETEQALFNYYIKTLAAVVGSDEEAKKKIYLVSCGFTFGFGAEIDEETSDELYDLPGVIEVLEDFSPKFRKGNLGVRSPARFNLTNHNHRLDNVFSYHHLSEKNSKWNSDHWLIVIKQPECGFTTEAQTLDFFIKILAEAIGSEQLAKEKIYIIWSNFPLGFGAEIDEETSNKLKGCPNVLKVLPDYAFDVKDKVTGGLLISHSLQKSRFYYYSLDSLKNLKGVHWRNPLEHPDYTDDGIWA